MKKKNIILLVVTIVLFVLLGTTMAYFGWSSSEENKDQIVDVTISGGSGSCDMFEDNNKLLYPTSAREKGRIIKVKVKQKMAQNAFVSWNLVINSINRDSLTTSGLKHKTFKYELINDTTGLSYGTGSFENVTNNSTITLSTNKETLIYNKEYIFILYLWIDGTIGTNPSDMMNEPYNFDLNCNITGTDMKVVSELPKNIMYRIKYLYNMNDKTTVKNNNIEYSLTDSTIGLMNDRLGGTTTSLDGGNIRYYGAAPNNYIYFNCETYPDNNCELWRIIGLFDGKIKIIRNESIGEFSWDNKDLTTGAETSFGKNDWTTARLMKLLNPKDYYTTDINDNGLGQSLYYNSGSGKCFSGQNNATVDCDFSSTGIKNDTTRNMISEIIWNLGGWKGTTLYSDQIYGYERGTLVYTGRGTTWKGKIGLMYPSDYGYAADFSKCKQSLYNYDNEDCKNNDWLFNGIGQDFLTTPSSFSERNVSINPKGYVRSNASYGISNKRPVLYLNNKMEIVSGDGSSSDPFRISA